MAWWYPSQLDRIEMQVTLLAAKLDAVIYQGAASATELTKLENMVKMAYEAELAAAEAAAKANSDTDDSVEQILKVVTDLVANLKTGTTDPATAKRITDLAAALTARSAQLAAAAAAVPTS